MDDDLKDEERRRAAVDHGIRWSWATLLQIERLREAEAALTATAGEPPADQYGEAERAPFHRLRVEGHFAVVAARNLLRAVARLDHPRGKDAIVPPATRTHVRTLRDCFEHWDEEEHAETGKGNKGRAFRDFAALDLADDPASYRWGGSGTYIGGLSLDELEGLAHHLHAYFLELEATSFVWRGWSAVPDAEV
jgi:hypothetical protein